jgi:hypothetical protein
MISLIAFWLSTAALHNDIGGGDWFCACRNPGHGREYELCYWDPYTYPYNIYGLGNIAGNLTLFQSDASENCFYLFNMPVESNNADLFPEARAACAESWTNNSKYHINYDSSVSISPDGRFAIPYCYGASQIFMYEVRGMTRSGDFELVKTIDVPKGVEALRIFREYLIVLDSEKVIAYSMKPGMRFRKIADYPLPHQLYGYHLEGPQYEGQAPTFMLGMAMDGEYLYILNPPGNGYGALLTLQIEENAITLVNDGTAFPEIAGVYALRNNVQINEVFGKKYLSYMDQDCDPTAAHGGTKYLILYRLENNTPVFLRRDAKQCFSSYLEWAYSFKNEYLYEHYTNAADEPCPNQISIFDQAEQFHWFKVLSMLGITQGPDTELIDSYGRAVACSTEQLPVVTHTILPDRPVSQNFLVMGTASSAEGIRRVFAGLPLCFNMRRASLFPQPDGSVMWMAVIPEVPPSQCPVFWTACNDSPYDFIYMPLAEDGDGDSNQSPDAEPDADHVCLQFAQVPDPLPFGAVDHRAPEYDTIQTFSGWALDNSGIWQGWLFSEDAQVLLPLEYGCERPDIAAEYPEYPDSLHSGFSITYDGKNLPDGEYAFKIRIVAKDYQVLDLGPYIVSISNSGHRRPVSPP